MVTSLNEQTNDLSSCSVCYDTFNDMTIKPKYLSCWHTFCLECIKVIIQLKSLFVNTVSLFRKTNWQLQDRIRTICSYGHCDQRCRIMIKLLINRWKSFKGMQVQSAESATTTKNRLSLPVTLVERWNCGRREFPAMENIKTLSA